MLATLTFSMRQTSWMSIFKTSSLHFRQSSDCHCCIPGCAAFSMEKEADTVEMSRHTEFHRSIRIKQPHPPDSTECYSTCSILLHRIHIHINPQAGTIRYVDHAIANAQWLADQLLTKRMSRSIIFKNGFSWEQRVVCDG